MMKSDLKAIPCDPDEKQRVEKDLQGTYDDSKSESRPQGCNNSIRNIIDSY